MTGGANKNAGGSKNRLWFIVIGTLTIALAIVVSRQIRSNSNTDIRHVVFISLDTTRADHLGCYGNEWIETPTLDKLAEESVLLTDYMTAVSTTLASHVTLLTGKYPHTHGVPRNGFVVNDDNLMLPEILKKAGFVTAGFLGAFALHDRFNFDQGFDHFDEEFDVYFDGDKIGQDQRRAPAVNNAVFKYLSNQGITARTFLFIHYFDAHYPYDPPSPYDAMYGEEPSAIPLVNHPSAMGKALSIQARKSLASYAGEISYMDEQLGLLIEDLRSRGILDHSLLVITSDHGENPEDLRGRKYHHGRTVYQAEMNCVAMIRFPDGRYAGMQCDAPTASVDIVPTVLSALGLPVPVDVEGVSLDFDKQPATPPERLRFGEASKSHKWEVGEGWYNEVKPRCIRQGPFKFIRTIHRNSRELYDLSTDPYEMNDLLASPDVENEALAAELERALDEWAASANPLPSHFEKEQYDDTMARLKSLGYLGDDEESDEEEGGKTP